MSDFDYYDAAAPVTDDTVVLVGGPWDWLTFPLSGLSPAWSYDESTGVLAGPPASRLRYQKDPLTGEFLYVSGDVL